MEINEMDNKLRYAADADTLEGKLMDVIGVGITEARSADFLMKSCKFTNRGQLDAAIASAWAHKNPILQYHGQYFRPANAEELVKYISRQSNAKGERIVEFK